MWRFAKGLADSECSIKGSYYEYNATCKTSTPYYKYSYREQQCIHILLDNKEANKKSCSKNEVILLSEAVSL